MSSNITSASPILEIENLSVRYSGVPAVRGISLSVSPGEMIGLIGANGAGKTSTLRAIAGITPSTSDSILFDGESIKGITPEKLVRRGLALVPEGHPVFGTLSVADNLRLGAVGRAEKKGLAEDLAWVRSLFPIVEEFAGRQASLLSGGQQQQLVIARALLSRPRLLVLDEPSLGLSPTAVDTVFGALAEVRSRGTAVLIVEQRAKQTIALSDRTYVLNEGQITMTLTPDAASDAEVLKTAYLGA